MLDWPSFALIVTPTVGIIILLLNRILGNENLFHSQWKIVLFVITASTFQTALLGRDYWGVSASGLFRLDGLNTHFLLCFLVFSLLNHISLRFDRARFESETGILQLAYVLSGTVFIMANNLMLYVLAAPMVFLISGTSALCNSATSKSKGFRNAVMTAMITMFMFAFSAALVGAATDTLELDRMAQAIVATQRNPEFLIGWSLHILICGAMMLLPPMVLFLKTFENSESWSLVGFFRMSLPLLGVILFSKWIFLTGFQFDLDGALTSILEFSATDIAGYLSCVSLALALIVLLQTQKVILFVQTTLTVGLFLALLSATFVGPEGILIAQSALYLFVFCTTVAHLSLSKLGLSTTSTLADLRDALQKATVLTQMSFLLSLLASAPLFTFVGFDISKKLFQRTDHLTRPEHMISFAVLVFMAALTIVIVNRVIEIFIGNAKRNSVWDDQVFSAKMWSYVLLVSLLILGIYPTPLYKYLSHSINLFVKNAS